MIPTVVEFVSPIDHALLIAAVQRVLGRHPSLRSRFRLDADGKRIEYHTDGDPAAAGFIDVEADGWSPDDLDRLLEVLCYEPFDLANEPPVRAEIIRIDAIRTLLVFSVHHIVCDGWSRTLLIAEIAKVYRASAAGTDPVLSSPPHPSKVVTMANSVDAAERVPEIVDRLKGVPMGDGIPFRRSTDDTSLAGASQSSEFDEELTEALMTAAAEEGCTPFMTAVALLASTLARTGEQRDFLFAFGWPGREDPAAAEAIGMFMNTAVLRVQIGETATWRDLLRETRAAAMEAFIDADVPLDAVTAGLRPNRDVIWPPLSTVLVNMTEVPADMVLGPDLTGKLVPLPSLHMKYDLGLFVRLLGSGSRKRLELSVDYIKALYAHDDIAGLFADLRRSAKDLTHSLEDTVTEQSAPTNDLTTSEGRIGLVRDLWLEVLKLDNVADDVSFFDVGGDSLLLIVLVEKLSEATGRPIRTTDLFRAGTIKSQAALLVTPAKTTASSPASGSSRDRLLDAARSRSAVND